MICTSDRLLLVALALVLVTGLTAGCSASDGGDTTEPTTGKTEGSGSGSSAEEATGGEITIETFEAWLAEQPDTDVWYSKATSSEMTKRLRKPTIVVFVDMPGGELQSYANTVTNEWANSDDGQTTNVRLVSSDGMVFQGGMPLSMEFAESVPEPPTSPGAFMTWLDEAYGPASGDPVDEEWYARIESAGPNLDREAVEVQTDLDYTSMVDRELANTIGEVLKLAHPQGTSGWIVRFGDGEYELSSVY